MRKILISLIVLILMPVNIFADYISNNFLVVEDSMDFEKTVRSNKCYGSIPYPRLFNDDEELSIKINEEIKDFAEIYVICNKGERDHFSVSFDVPFSGTKDFFSVRWFTKKDEKLWRIDTLNFNAENGNLLSSEDIFNLLSDNMMPHMVALSEGHLDEGASWEDFLRKIKSRDVQFYIKDKKWYIVFNSHDKLERVVDVEIPGYFLIGSGDDDRG